MNLMHFKENFISQNSYYFKYFVSKFPLNWNKCKDLFNLKSSSNYDPKNVVKFSKDQEDVDIPHKARWPCHYHCSHRSSVVIFAFGQLFDGIWFSKIVGAQNWPYRRAVRWWGLRSECRANRSGWSSRRPLKMIKNDLMDNNNGQ